MTAILLTKNGDQFQASVERVEEGRLPEASPIAVPPLDGGIALKPTLPIDGRTPSFAQRWPKARVVYWVNSTHRRNARKLPRTVDTLGVELSGRILGSGGSDEEIEVH